MIAAVGEDAPVGTHCKDGDDEYLDDYVAFHWVCIGEDGKIVGTEGDDYESKLKPGEVNAIGVY